MRKLLFFIFFISYQSVADWQVNTDKSNLHFISVKQSHITEVHSVQSFSGTLKQNGSFSLKVDLSSIETGIDIRNKRMKEWLFDLVDHRYAVLQGELEVDLASIKEQQTSEFTGSLSLNGNSQKVDGQVMLSRTANGALHASLTAPLLIQTSKFNLTEGVEKLREIAGLKSISYTVPVTGAFYLSKTE